MGIKVMYAVQYSPDGTDWEDTYHGPFETLKAANRYAEGWDQDSYVRVVKRTEEAFGVRCRKHKAFEADNCPGCGTSAKL